MKPLFFIFIFSIASIFSFSQNPLVKMWDHRYGGDLFELLNCLQQTPDGGYILGGSSRSNISGDKSENSWGNSDFWLVKIDLLGNKQWDKGFGGSEDDILYAIEKTKDGGYIIGGWTSSGISGNKTEPLFGGGIGSDFWIVKTDTLGNKQWDKDFGGSAGDVIFSVKQTADNGYIIGGYSTSGVSGNKSEPNWGNADYWIIKLDSVGHKLWEKDFGSFSSDIMKSMQLTNDGGYILGGSSASGIGGDKSQSSWGLYDYWLVKIDSIGNKQWDRDYGGFGDDKLFSIIQTFDGGYLLGGVSNSGISGDKSQDTIGQFDYWIVKIDSLGNKQWDKDFGGNKIEDLLADFGSLIQTRDSGYLVAASSFSNMSGDKSEDNLGLEQTWVVKMDSLGNKIWDKTLHTDSLSIDQVSVALQSTDNCYVMANFTSDGIAGDKTETSRGNTDYWVIKFCDSTLVPALGFTTNTYICPGSCIDFINLTFNAINYQWKFIGAVPDTSTSFNPINICYPNPGSYDVQLIASNANGSDTLLLSNYITVYPSPPPQSITQNGDTLFAIAGSASYQWYFNGSIINGATDYLYVATLSGDYNVVATDVNGCEVEAVLFGAVLSTESAVDENEPYIFPNPVDGELGFGKWEMGNRTDVDLVAIYNTLGERIPVSVDRQHSTVDCRQLSTGIYFIEIRSSGKLYRGKFVKQ